MSLTRWTALTASMLFAATTLSASTFVVPSDDKLIERSDAVFVGTCINSYTRMSAPGRIETVYQIAIDESLKGPISDSMIDVVEPGGRFGNSWLVVGGSPVYEVGLRFLVFVDRRPDGEWTTRDLTLGRFRFEADDQGTSYVARDTEAIHGWSDDGSAHTERLRLADDFVKYIRARVAGKWIEADYFAEPVGNRPLSSGTIASEPSPERLSGRDFVFELAEKPARRQNPSSIWRIAGAIDGLDLRAAVATGISAWVDDSESDVRFAIEGTPAQGIDWGDDGEDRVIAGDPTDQVMGTFPHSSVIAATFSGCSDCGDHLYHGETYAGITYADIVINDGVSSRTFSQDKLATTLAHELGHSLGFRHSNRAPDGSDCGDDWPCTNDAVMNSWIEPGLGGSLQGWDRLAVQTVYGDGAPCGVEIINQPARFTRVDKGDRARLGVVAYSPVDVTFQWFEGESGDSSKPIPASNAPFLITAPLTGPANYWVRISSGCGTRDSDTARVDLVTRRRGASR